MGISWWVRNTIFSFCGGYTMTSFYNDAVRLGRQNIDKPKKSSGRRLWWGTAPPPTTFSQDARETIIENEVACALALAAIVLAGGLSAMAGGFMSFMLEGPDGPQRYLQLRDAFRDLRDGEV